ncbi:cyclic nucleotide-gated ion channel 1 [Pyrus x bretschneideri]|uniref:cyclic nucleotide-gated ion channel 1 n=1 Tax=Pyrus x bretschneideri TaxID=225117 RepID=UPI00202FF201|nr:cyclic nucleotide-gated ion channel 1 [Pyrus x bretschneideri]
MKYFGKSPFRLHMNRPEVERVGNSSLQVGSANIDYGRNRPVSCREIFGPNGVRNAVFVLLLCFAVSAEPLFLFTPTVDKDMKCIKIDKLAVVALSLRFLTDFYLLSAIIVQLVPTREVATPQAGPNVGRRGSAKETLGRCNLIVNIFAVAPIPYVVIPFFAKMLRHSKMFLNFLVVPQYIVRFIQFNWFSQKLEKDITKDAPEIWTQTVFKLGVRSAFILFKSFHACVVFGAFWYFFAIQLETVCWQYACRSENGCELGGFNCKDEDTFGNVTLLNNICRPANPPTETSFNFGIFLDAIQSGILSSTDFPRKFLHCFLWGLQNLSSKGTNLQTSSNAWETLFALSVCLLGWVLASLYIFTVAQGIIELSRKNGKLTEMKKKISPLIEDWLKENDLPLALKEKIVTSALGNKLRADEVINIINIHNILPRKDLMDIKRRLCLNTLNKVPMLQNVSEAQFEVFCEYLKPVIYKASTFITREGEQFDKILFITQGEVRTYTTSVADGRGSSSTGNTLGDDFQKGDFCGQELLQACESTGRTISHSTKNVWCSTKVEGFTLTIEDMKKGIGEMGEN